MVNALNHHTLFFFRIVKCQGLEAPNAHHYFISNDKKLMEPALVDPIVVVKKSCQESVSTNSPVSYHRHGEIMEDSKGRRECTNQS